MSPENVDPAGGPRAFLRLALFGLLIFSPLPFGSVQGWAVMTVELWAIGLGALAIWLLWRSPIPLGARGRWLVALTGALLLLGLIQLLPLPEFLAGLLAPAVADVRGLVYEAIPEAAAGFRPASLSPPETVDAVARLVAYGLIGLATVVAVRRPADLRQAALVLVISGTFQAFYGAFEYLSGRQQIFGYVNIHAAGAATGTFINRNHFAGYLAMTLPMALGLLATASSPALGDARWRERLLRLLEGRTAIRLFAAMAVFCIWIGVLLSYSRAGLAAAIAACGTLWLLTSTRRRGWLLLAALALPTLFLVYLDVDAPGGRFGTLDQALGNDSGRIPAWHGTWRMALGSPLLGTGFGTFEQAFPLYRPPTLELRWDHAHNDWLQAAAEGGLGALALLLAMAALTLWPVDRYRFPAPRIQLWAAACAGVAAIAVHSLADFCLRIPAIAVLLATLVGLRVCSFEWDARD